MRKKRKKNKNFKKIFIKNSKKYFLFCVIIVLVYMIIYAKKPKVEKMPEFVRDVKVTKQEEEKIVLDENIIPTFANIKQIDDFELLQKYVYTVDETAFVDKDDLPINDFLEYDFKTGFDDDLPKVLIFHTHSQEAFIDSKEGDVSDTIVGVGRELADILSKKYGVSVVHDVGTYDLIDDKISRGNSYEIMEESERKILERYPSIEVMIDLHRDGVLGDKKLVTEIEGEPTAKIMFFNGVSKLNKNGTGQVLENLQNPYLKDNLAFSLHMYLTANELYPTLTRKNYIKAYRYSLHLRPKSLLVEVGANTSTVKEAKNAMKPLAEILMSVVKKTS